VESINLEQAIVCPVKEATAHSSSARCGKRSTRLGARYALDHLGRRNSGVDQAGSGRIQAAPARVRPGDAGGGAGAYVQEAQRRVDPAALLGADGRSRALMAMSTGSSRQAAGAALDAWDRMVAGLALPGRATR
jgi:hypothetical protein